MTLRDIIEDIIPIGHAHAVKRAELRELLGMNDRDTRRAVEQARKLVPIINMSDGTGYFMPDPDNDIDCCRLDEYIAQEKARVRAINDNIRVCELWREQHGIS